MNKKSAFVLSGGVSLGTYEAGVMTAVLQAVRAGIIDIDIVGGSSAGALTGFAFAFALGRGLSPYELYNLWVDKADIGRMTFTSNESILTTDRLKADLDSMLEADEICPYHYLSSGCTRHNNPSFCSMRRCASVLKKDIKLTVELTNLEGYVTPMPVSSSQIYNAKIHHDSITVDFSKWEQYDTETIKSFLFASAAIPVVFTPVNIKRVLSELEPPASSHYNEDEKSYNFIDGGITDNLPVKSVLKACRSIEALYIVIPDPFDALSLIERTNRRGGFMPLEDNIAVLMNTNAAANYQTVYTDIKRAVDINRSILTVKDLKNYVEEHVRDPGTAEKIISMAESAADTRNKHIIEISVLSPQYFNTGLAGDILAHAGGFLDRRLRHYDFCIGYYNAVKAFSLENRIPLLFEKPAYDLSGISFRDVRDKKNLIKAIIKLVPVLFNRYMKNAPGRMLRVIYMLVATITGIILSRRLK
ncbi:MAG: patatin-like phospholipase family protein [candidate division WOR-3 bacterium]|nr:patatin-like phospholipase family protein [candidate division WOR-3 bacterium]